MFDGFALTRCEGDGAHLRVRRGGDGPAVLLLHGHPRTHVTWHRVAPLLAASGRTVVCPDLRGYGRSDKPPTDPEHRPYAKRAMAADCLAVMRRLGHERFAVVGHDRGAYVATRLALDHPQAVSALTVLDAVPIGEALRRCDAVFAARWWHWFFLGQTDKAAERVINADPDAWYRATPEQMGAEAYQDYQRAIHDPATVHAMCEDYRAGLGIDREHDDTDRRAGRRITCPVQVLWATRDDMADLHGDVLGVWRDWTGDRLDGGPIDSGHHIAEDAPEALVTALRAFWRSASDSRGPTAPHGDAG
ncbi:MULTISPECIES: alpha/beta fold hydrolase [Streptomycetaceae]|uniref:Alpha/beta hydrolase fold protein n=1 Tax=Streptantibioticus cattleyicolor (strain ATCC 35852 / DSM 46488 / JCM 4925 / NBRC 14057 / NRRL 8057) TaxID=1003195 RepID=F8K3R2_STREN|nr:alpha/beta hydrolase [Streptantibioticus cattleyicolor]AEW97599.1 alpha/beta hydrolase fold protein [Streptantibioticus cattleyicolor NRRL 8057 = DSM 46488]MYS62030.1 alpha/beta fold hydrolase [Streptomyces sp. SID5468]CCB77923.1 Hydrolase [Streptantibioticus cattleyicolor NRRL 8057 = DSM 46488]